MGKIKGFLAGIQHGEILMIGLGLYAPVCCILILFEGFVEDIVL